MKELILLFGLIAAAGLFSCNSSPGVKADLVLTNGYIYTVDKDRTVARAVAIADGTIIYAGTDEGTKNYTGEKTQVVDLKGRMLLPAFTDSHNHPDWAVTMLFDVQLYKAESAEDCLEKISIFMAEHPDIEALRGFGWMDDIFGSHGPTKEILDGIVPNIPAFLISESGHEAWVNSKTLELAGITRDTPDPAGGSIVRDADGNPSGTLKEWSAMALVANAVPTYTAGQMQEGLRYYQEKAHSMGITTSYIAEVMEDNPGDLKALRDFEASGEMTIRFPAAVLINPISDPAEIEGIVKNLIELRDGEAGGNFEIIAAKLIMDGTLEGATAYMEKDYIYPPDTRGELLWVPDLYNEMCAAIDKAGMQIHVHSIGNAATRIALDGLSYARNKNGTRDARPILAHLQFVNSSDISRLAQLGAIAVPSPFWFVIDIFYQQAVAYIGKALADRQYPMLSFFNNGTVVASSSDFPVVPVPAPLIGIEVGVTRKVPAGSGDYIQPDYDHSLNPSEKVTVEQMIESYTINGAYASFLEKKTGSIEVGKKADLILLDKNILQIPPEEIHTASVLLTYFEGREVYRSDSYAE